MIQYRNDTLLNYVIGECQNVREADTYVVLGYMYDEIKVTISHTLEIIKNNNFLEGMGSSISASMKHLQDDDYKAVLLVLCDQNRVNTGILNAIINEYKSSDDIIVSRYSDGSNGPPTLFGKDYFEQLKTLTGDFGAKSIIRSNQQSLSFVAFPGGELDIDTHEDLMKLLE